MYIHVLTVSSLTVFGWAEEEEEGEGAWPPVGMAGYREEVGGADSFRDI